MPLERLSLEMANMSIPTHPAEELKTDMATAEPFAITEPRKDNSTDPKDFVALSNAQQYFNRETHSYPNVDPTSFLPVLGAPACSAGFLRQFQGLSPARGSAYAASIRQPATHLSRSSSSHPASHLSVGKFNIPSAQPYSPSEGFRHIPTSANCLEESQRRDLCQLLFKPTQVAFEEGNDLQVSIKTSPRTCGPPLGAVTVFGFAASVFNGPQVHQKMDLIVCSHGGTTLTLSSTKFMLSLKVPLSVGCINLPFGLGNLLFLPQLTNYLTAELNHRQACFDEHERDVFSPKKIFRSGIGRVPQEIFLCILDQCLIAPGGIISLRELDGEVVVTITSGKYLRPALLAVNSYFHELGTPRLYQKNAFRLCSELLCDPSKTARFFSIPHLIPDGGSIFSATFVRRSELIKAIELRDVENSFDGFALDGSIPPSLSVTRAPHISWLFAVLRRMEWVGFNLDSLSFTLNENDPRIQLLLGYETEMRKLSEPAVHGMWLTHNEVSSRPLVWKNMWGDNWIMEPYPYDYDEVATDCGIVVKKLRIDGTSADAHSDQDCSSNHEPLIPNPAADDAKQWLESTGIFAAEIEFIGPVGGYDESEAIEHNPEAFNVNIGNWTQ